MQSEIFQAFICYKCDDYGSQLMKTPNSKLEYFMKSIKKKRILNTEMLAL